MAPRTIDPDSPPVATGQTRIDQYGSRIVIVDRFPGGAWAVVYPRTGGEVHIYGEATIRKLYPIVTDAAPNDRRPA